MKEKILEVLMKNTEIGTKYMGGYEDPLIVFVNSLGYADEADKKIYLEAIAEEIEKAIQ